MNSPQSVVRNNAFTLVEILVTVAIVGVLAAAVLGGYKRLVTAARKARSTENLHMLAVANQSYAAEHEGYYCPAQDRRNRTRWHGGRGKGSGPFDPKKGFLSAYLGDAGHVEMCPEFLALVRKQKQQGSFEVNSGGYGYNASYVGGTVSNAYEGATTTQVRNPSTTVMFTTTALAKDDGLQEYPFSEPYQAVSKNGQGSGLQPSTHFRFNGKALVAWCDGHVTEESPSTMDGPNYYGGDNAASLIGWFGPREDNGFWNPDSPAANGEPSSE